MNLSLNYRLFLSAGIVLCVFLGATGLALDQAFSISLDNIVREKLQSHTYALLAVADNDNGRMYLPAQMSEQRFNIEGESLIAIVTDSRRQEHWRSVSAAARYFKLPAPDAGEWLFGRAQDNTGEYYYVSSYSTIWPDSRGRKTTFVFTVMESINYYRKELSDYRLAITVALAIVGLILLALQAIILRWGLRPVRGLAVDVDAVSNGELQSLSGEYPKELQPLTSNLNLLIDNERRQRQRYRDRMADLSHSLKTPLSVLQGIELDVDDDGQPISRDKIIATLRQQAGRMNDIVNYQLQRAVSSGRQTSFVATNIKHEVESIIGALDKVYAEKNIAVEILVDATLSFYGDEYDLAEILGNLLDNAYKHCRQQVRVCANTLSVDGSDVCTLLTVEDDGAGIPQAKRFDILKRGVRLDSTSAGQGFGLAIVVDIMASYKGTISIGDSSLGGALFTLKIPAV